MPTLLRFMSRLALITATVVSLWLVGIPAASIAATSASSCDEDPNCVNLPYAAGPNCNAQECYTTNQICCIIVD